MTQLLRRNSGALVALVLALLIEVFGLSHGGLGKALIIAVAAMVVLAIAVRLDMARAAMWATYAATFTLSWNGWYVGPIRPGDVLVLLALMLFVASSRREPLPRLPLWVVQLAIVIVLLCAIFVAFPEKASYLATRTVINGRGQPTVSTGKSLPITDIGVAFKFLVSIAAIPICFVYATIRDSRAVRRLAIAFGFGTAISGWSAALERFGIPNIDKVLTHISVPGAPRQIGLSYHPNFLAASLVIALPFAIWQCFEPGWRNRLFGAAGVLGCLLGVYATGSRGGTVTIVFALFVSVAATPRTRRYIGLGIGVAIALAGLVFAAAPSLGHQILVSTRLIGGITTSGSNEARAIVGAQGEHDFAHSPLIGIGYQVATEAQNVYLQELATGGLLLLVSLSTYYLWAMIDTGRLINRSPLAAAIFSAVLSATVLNIFEADLTDRFYYVPQALAVALVYLARNRIAGSPDEAIEKAQATRSEPLDVEADVPVPG